MRMSRYSMVWGLAAAVLIGIGLAGCQGRASIPPGAQLEQSGTGGLSYTAREAGNVFILDADTNTKVFEGHVNNGDQVVIKPDQDKIIVGGNEAEHGKSLNPNHRYQIYFTPSH